MTHRAHRKTLAYALALVAVAALRPAVPTAMRLTATGSAQNAAAGQAVVTLADGRLLVTGGEADPGQAEIRDPRSGRVIPLANLGQPRAWHSMTVLPDGRVLIFGGTSHDVTLSAPEIFDPARQRFEFIPDGGLLPRAHHTATLLTDERVLIAGGVSGGTMVPTSDLWDSRDRTVIAGAGVLPEARLDHSATLGADGTVSLTNGRNALGNAVTAVDVFDPVNASFTRSQRGAGSSVEAMFISPADGAVDVPITTRIAARLGRPLRGNASVRLAISGPAGDIPLVAIPTEEGRLWFFTPLRALARGTWYDIEVNGERVGGFRTELGTGSDSDPSGADSWTPSAASGWKTNLKASPWQSLPPLEGPSGAPSLAGQVLSVAGNPLAGVQLSVGSVTGETDRTGRFVLGPLTAGTHVLIVHGHSTGAPPRDYGMHEIQVDVIEGRTTVLPFTVWLSPIDHRTRVALRGPDKKRVETTRIPGLRVELSAGTSLVDRGGRTVEDLSITPIPLDRAPMPAPPGIQALAMFTLQTHGAQVRGPRGAGVSIRYPNTIGLPPGSAVDLWTYDAHLRGWGLTGRGYVTADGRQVSSVTIASSSSGSSGSGSSGSGGNSGSGGGNSGPGSVNCIQLASSSGKPATGPKPGDKKPGADPVDLGSGLFVLQKTDLSVSDILPLHLTRTYRQNDATSRAFGIGASHPFDLLLTGPVDDTYADLVLPDGGVVHFDRTSSGTGHLTAVMVHTATRTAFYKSVLTWNASTPGYQIALTDGTVYKFGTLLATGCRLVAIVDRFGNQITIERNGIQIRRVVSPNGRGIEFTYDASDRVTQAKDTGGRTVSYSYDGSGRLSDVTDAAGGVTDFTYDTSHRMLTITDPRNITYLTNTYDGSGRVATQTLADGGVYEFTYTVNGAGEITQTDLENPRGYTRRVTFSNQLPMTDTYALGQAIEQTTSYARVTGTALVESITDPLGRVTHYAYDTNGHPTSLTRLYGTADAVATTATYESTYGQLASLTDPLSHTTNLTYDSQGRLASVTSPLSHQTTFARNSAGQLTSVTSPISHTTQFTYQFGDLVAMQTPSGGTATQFVDALGRTVRSVDALGRVTRIEYNALDQITKITDPIGAETSFTYDANGNLLTLTDARGKTTTWTYNSMDRVATRTDPLSRQESFTYDLNGNLTEWTDRKSQVTIFHYDALDRQTFVGYDATGSPATYESTVTTTYDDGNRAVSIVDSAAGTIARAYDGLDRLTQETTPQGTIDYTYDAAGRRTSMQVVGQTTVSYGYDNSNRLTTITQGTAAVSITYDNADRRTTLTLPNGIVIEYDYDTDSQLAGLTYKHGGSTLGALTYAYDAGGQRIFVDGSWARSNLPAAVTSATYDDANQIVTWAGATFAYDANGNLTSGSGTSYTWNARNELISLNNGATTATFAYDAARRRRAVTVSSTTKEYLYDGINVVQELVGGTPTVNLLLGLDVDEYLSRMEGSSSEYFLADGLRSTVALADGLGSVQTAYTYTPFGATTATGAATANRFGFGGRELEDAGIYFHRARYFDTSTQRFISGDPLQFAGGDVNFYAYSANDPVSNSDPLGLTWGRNISLLKDFFTGGGSPTRKYGAGDQETSELANSPGIDELRKRFKDGGCKSLTDGSYGTFQAFLDTVLNPFNNDWSSTAAQVGGFARARVTNNGNGTSTFYVRNVAGAKSFFYHIVPNRQTKNGIFSSIEQIFEWTEATPCPAGRK